MSIIGQFAFQKLGYPKNGWFIRETPKLKWMTLGYPILGNFYMVFNWCLWVFWCFLCVFHAAALRGFFYGFICRTATFFFFYFLWFLLRLYVLVFVFFSKGFLFRVPVCGFETTYFYIDNMDIYIYIVTIFDYVCM